MNKKLNIFLTSVLGISTVLVYVAIGYFLFQRGLLFPEAGASPATCTVDDALRVNGTGIGINADAVENAPEDKILNIQTGTDWPRIILESTHSPSSKAELNLWARDGAGSQQQMNIFHTAGNEMGIWTSYNGNMPLVILPNDNVGIGMTTPGEKLEVNGLIKIPQATASDNNSPGITLVSDDDFLYNGGYLNHYGFGFHDPTAGCCSGAYISGYSGIDLFTGGQNRLTILEGGDVGIAGNLNVSGDINDKTTILGDCEWLSQTSVSSNCVAEFDSPSCPAGKRPVACSTSTCGMGDPNCNEDVVLTMRVFLNYCFVWARDIVGGCEHNRMVQVLCCEGAP